MGYGALHGMGITPSNPGGNFGAGGTSRRAEPTPSSRARGDEVERLAAALKGKPLPPPVRVILFCPRCRGQHVDRDEWATHSHKTHLCAHCKHEWCAADVPTVGVEEL